jgi:hypothetical protein
MHIGTALDSVPAAIRALAEQDNPFFTEHNVHVAISAIRTRFLDPLALRLWLSKYRVPTSESRRVGIIMAGNIPLAGFHDLLCVAASGHQPVVKLSHKDKVLMQFVIDRLNEHLGGEAVVVDSALRSTDAVIASGSDNSVRYFEYYFGNRPHVFRRNRNSVAVLSGAETAQQIADLGEDVFRYYGLGCRSVSKVFLPAGHEPELLFPGFEVHRVAAQVKAYDHNFRYQLALHEMNSEPTLTNGFLILDENETLSSPIAVLHYSHYGDLDEVRAYVRNHRSRIQCVVTALDMPDPIPFGTTQQPSLSDYADGIDTMRFLEGL